MGQNGVQNGQVTAVPVVGQIMITMTADGAVNAQCQLTGGRVQLLGMLEHAKIELDAKLIEQQKAAREQTIARPNPGGILLASG